jgi:putative pyruvate formate lyase activating enzyme
MSKMMFLVITREVGMPVHTQIPQFMLASKDFEPAYMALFRRGQLQQRAATALEQLQACHLCPRDCGADRVTAASGFCQTGRDALVSSYFPHTGEEDPLRGSRGSGTIFFSMCNLGCVFCQNFDISQSGIGEPVSPEQLAHMMLSLQKMGCHNINFVTPSHVVPHILEALPIAVEQGLHLPLVYNTSAYDSLEALRLLDGVIDIYMPDVKFWDPALAQRYVRASDYPAVAQRALREMHRQVGDLVLDEDGIAKRGLLVRHLVMPNMFADSEALLRFLAEEISPHTYVNVMAQYRPSGHVNSKTYPDISRRTSGDEYIQTLDIAEQVGLYRLDDRRTGWTMQLW